MASDRLFNPNLHKRLIEIMDEVSQINEQIEWNMRLLNDRPELAADIRQLMMRCTSLVSEAVELRTSSKVYSAGEPSRSPASEGSGAAL